MRVTINHCNFFGDLSLPFQLQTCADCAMSHDRLAAETFTQFCWLKSKSSKFVYWFTNKKSSCCYGRHATAYRLQLLLQYWPSKSSKINDFHFTWKGLCDFLLVININLGLISHCLATIQPWPTDERTDNRRIMHARDYSIAAARQKEGVCFWGTKFYSTDRRPIWLDGVQK